MVVARRRWPHRRLLASDDGLGLAAYLASGRGGRLFGVDVDVAVAVAVGTVMDGRCAVVGVVRRRRPVGVANG